MTSEYQPLEHAPTATAIDRFLTLFLLSGLRSFADISRACSDFDTRRTDDMAVADLGRHLIQAKVLTDWQYAKLIQGKYKGFLLDGYKFMEQIGKDATTSTYLVEEASTGSQFAMVVTPPRLVPNYDGRIRYEISELPG